MCELQRRDLVEKCGKFDDGDGVHTFGCAVFDTSSSMCKYCYEHMLLPNESPNYHHLLSL